MLFFYVRNWVTAFVSLRRRVSRTLYDLYSPCFLPEVMVKFTRKARGHFVPLIQSVIHQITDISGLNLNKEIQGSREEQTNWVRELTTLSP